MFPVTAVWLSAFGGILIGVVGLLYVGVAIVYHSVLERVLPGSTPLYLIFGVVSFVAGISILVLGFRLRSDPMSARRSGTTIMLLSLLSFPGGGGLYLGLLVAFAGGVMARTWRPPSMPQLRDGFSQGRPLVGQPPGSPRGPWPPTPPS